MRRRAVLGAIAGGLGLGELAGRGRPAGTAFGPLAWIEVTGTAETVVTGDGCSAFVTTGDGFAAIDLTDPAAPRVLSRRRDLLADRPGGPLVDVRDLAIEGDRLLVPGPADHAGDRLSGFLLVDVAKPAEPVTVGTFVADAPIHNAALAGDRAYLFGSTEVVIVDVSGDPHEVGRWAPADHDVSWAGVDQNLWRSHDGIVRDGVGFFACWDAGTWVVDVADPGEPAVLAVVADRTTDDLAGLTGAESRRESTEAPGNHHSVRLSDDGSLLAIGHESWDAEAGDGRGGPSGVDLYDVTDPSAPAYRSTIAPPRARDETRRGVWTTAHNVDLTGGQLYSAWYQGGVRIHDVGEPTAPRELAWWRDPASTAFWTAQALPDRGRFVASGSTYVDPGHMPGLFVFPDRAGNQAGSPNDLRDEPFPSSTRTPRGGRSPHFTAPMSRTTTGGQAGFGIGPGLAGIGLVWRWLGRRER